MQSFIARNDFKGRDVALFGTSWRGRGDEVKVMEELLKPKGAVIRGSFQCKGIGFSLTDRGHPTDEDIANARQFASEMKKVLQGG